MQVARAVAVAAVTASVVLIASPAGADITSPPGRCVATAAFQTGVNGAPFAVNTQELSPGQVVEVPIRDTVAWTGKVLGVQPGTPRPVSGSVSVELPPPFGTVTIDSWSGTTDKVENAGVKSYELPSAVPRGIEVEVRGVHQEGSQTWCTATATVKLAGSPWDSPVTFVSLVGLAGSGVALALSGRPKYPKAVA